MPRPIDAFALLAALAMPACSPAADDPAPATERRWTSLRDDLDRPALTVWGSSPDDAWIGGGGLASGRGALLLHRVGGRLDEVETGLSETLWWIHGVSADDAWAVGEHGVALRLAGGVWTRVATGTDATLYGVWEEGPDAAWAVGGTPTGAGDDDVLLRWDGHAWSRVAPPRTLGATYYKVWGAAADDVHVVGQGGLALHFDGQAWSEVATGTHADLFTVSGRSPRDVWAVGGAPATVLAWSGTAWARAEGAPPTLEGLVSGVSLGPDGTTLLAGERHQRWLRDASGRWRDGTEEPPARGDYHAAWVDARGDALAVGGNYLALGAPGVAPFGLVARWGE